MRSIFITLAFFISLTGFAQTQAGMNTQANESYKKANKELNYIYNKILTEYKTDTLFIKNLRASERIWIKFRDAELKVKYPERPTGYYGSSLPMCESMYLEKLTRERIKTLQQWINGSEEGDVCSGSVRIKN